MLVEGNTEKIAIPLIFDALGEDINRLGISVIECGGKTKLSLFVRVSQAIGIPHVVVADRDIREIKEEWSDNRKEREQERNKKHRKWNKDLVDLVDDDRLFFLDPDLEGVAGLPRSEDQKIDRAIEHFSSIQSEDIPEQLRAPAKFILQG